MANLLTTTTIGGVDYGTEWVGMIAPFAMTAVPSDWLFCDGSAVSRSTYADLYGVIGTTWGTGDGNTTFNTPDFRGEVMRGWDDGRGVDSGRNVASQQGHQKCQSMEYHWRNNPHDGGTYCGGGWGCQQVKHPGYPDAYGGVQPTRVHGGGWYHSNCGIGYGHERWTMNSGRSQNTCRNYALYFCIKF